MKKRIKRGFELLLVIFIFLTVTYLAFIFIDSIRNPTITGMVVYNIETNYENYTFTNASLYSFNDTFVNLSNGIRLKATYTFDNITNQTNITYPNSGIVDTLDFTPENLNSWDELTKNQVLNDQNTTYSYSIDSGDNWTLISDFNLSSVNSTKIKFRINLIGNTTETPVVNYLTLKYLTSIACVEDWQCGDWSECYENNTQIRTCTDNNACGSEDNIPDLTQTCTYAPTCTANWTALYNNCLVNDTKLMFYNDTSQCNNISTIPSDNNTYVICDYCLPNFTCSEYGNCTDDEKECLAVNDENDCYSLTGLANDNYTDDYSEFITECNVTEETSESSEEEGGGEETPGAGESTSKETKLSKCNYDISVNIPNTISFTEENNFKTNIKNKGCKIDKLSFSLSSEFKDIVKLPSSEILNLEKDKSAYINLSTNPLLTRIKPNLLIQGFAAKTIQKQTKNITGNLIVKGNVEGEVKIDKSIQINAEVILFDKIELEHKSPLFIIILLGLLISITVVYLTTKFKFKFKLK